MTTSRGEVDYLLEPERTMQLAEILRSVRVIKWMPEKVEGLLSGERLRPRR